MTTCDESRCRLATRPFTRARPFVAARARQAPAACLAVRPPCLRSANRDPRARALAAATDPQPDCLAVVDRQSRHAPVEWPGARDGEGSRDLPASPRSSHRSSFGVSGTSRDRLCRGDRCPKSRSAGEHPHLPTRRRRAIATYRGRVTVGSLPAGATGHRRRLVAHARRSPGWACTRMGPRTLP
jgi:hypothetical protein